MMSDMQSNEESEIRVLLVDDDEVALDELKEVIELEGWGAKTATTVDDALSTLADDPHINVVVSDYHFAGPNSDGANGMQFVSRAQARFSDREISYIILSGDPDALRSSLQVGASRFLSKPLLVDDFIHAIRSVSIHDADENAIKSNRLIAI